MGWLPVLECLLSGVRGCLWLRPVMFGVKWRGIPRTRLQKHLPGTRKTPRCGYRGPKCVASRITTRRYSGQIGGKILHAHDHRDGRKGQCGLLLGLVLFRLVVPPFQLRVVGPYLVRGVWFPSHLALKGTRPYSKFFRT
jgi:hypothetical protein